MTDLGSLTLNNIFGIQDTETLDNFLHNVPNIVPKKDSLLSPSGAPPSFPVPAAARPSHLDAIPEISPTQVDIHMASSSAGANRASDSKQEKHSSKSSKNGGVARSSDGYTNPCLISDSPNSPKKPESILSGDGNKSEEYAKRTKYSVFGNDIDTPPANGPHATEQESSPGKGAPRTRSVDEDSIGDDAGTPKRAGNDALHPAVSEVSISNTTLQTFLKNFSERNAEFAEALRLEGNKSSSSSMEALDLQRQVGTFPGHGETAPKISCMSVLTFLNFCYNLIFT